MPLLVDFVVALVDDDFLVVEGGGVVLGFVDEVDLIGVLLIVGDFIVKDVAIDEAFWVDEGCTVDEGFAEIDGDDGAGSSFASTQYEFPTITSQVAVIDGFLGTVSMIHGQHFIVLPSGEILPS